MTREEAIKVLSTYDMSEENDDTEFKDAIALAIRVLEQEPCEDCCNGNQIEKQNYVRGRISQEWNIGKSQRQGGFLLVKDCRN